METASARIEVDGSTECALTTVTNLDPDLWTRLRDHAREKSRAAEPAHDFFHVERVVANAIAIARGEHASDADEAIVSTAALLHELFTLPKSHPNSSRAGDICAEYARELLVRENAPTSMIEPISRAIGDHAFSKGVVPDALPSKVLQDADRLDALGAIGLARMWATCADMKRPFYSPDDPFCVTRAPDDKQWDSITFTRSSSSFQSDFILRRRDAWPCRASRSSSHLWIN